MALAIRLMRCLCIYLCLCLCQSLCLCIYLSVCVFVCVSLSLSVNVSCMYFLPSLSLSLTDDEVHVLGVEAHHEHRRGGAEEELGHLPTQTERRDDSETDK